MPSPINKAIDRRAAILAAQAANSAVVQSRTKDFAFPSVSYTPAANDVGKCISVAAGISRSNVFVRGNIYKTGDQFFVHNSSANTLTITQNTGVTIYMPNTISSTTEAATGNRLLAPRGIVTLLCTDSSTNTFVVMNGIGVF